jgi:hypothetical protein
MLLDAVEGKTLSSSVESLYGETLGGILDSFKPQFGTFLQPHPVATYLLLLLAVLIISKAVLLYLMVSLIILDLLSQSSD